MASLSFAGSSTLTGVRIASGTGAAPRASVQWRAPASVRQRTVAAEVYNPASVDPAQVRQAAL